MTNFGALKELIMMSIPSAAALIVRRIIEITNYLVVGRLGNPDYIAGIGLGITTSNITWVWIGVGLAGALDMNIKKILFLTKIIQDYKIFWLLILL